MHSLKYFLNIYSVLIILEKRSDCQKPKSMKHTLV
jgi:hypothetical protein